MVLKSRADIRKWLKEYRFIQKELKSRTEYMMDFKRILIDPLPESEKSLKKAYMSIINDMNGEIKKLRSFLQKIENVLDKLPGAERSVIYHRYIMGIDWITMPEYVMYEQRSCQNYEVKALKRIAKMNIEWDGADVK